MPFALTVSKILGGIGSSFSNLAFSIYLFSWDNLLTILNLVSPKRKIGRVTLEGKQGFAGLWPEFVPPKPGDSRSCCPALNALANHGIVARDGRNIPYTQLITAIRDTYNFAPSFCLYVPRYMAKLLTRDYKTDTINLSDFNVHNGIEHDASLTRHDAAVQPDQSVPATDLIEALLASASGPGNTLTAKDVSAALSKRRRECRQKNSEYSQASIHKVFGASNASTLLTILGGRIDDIRPFLLDERLPEGWESRIRAPWGLTMAKFNSVVLGVEMAVDERPSKATTQANLPEDSKDTASA